MSGLRGYLEQMDWMAREMKRPDSFEGYVLRNGRQFESQELSADEMAYVLRATKRGTFPIKQCYYNSQMILARDFEHRFTYVEGYCAHAIIPVLHGWLEIGGKVVDVTMRTKIRAKRRQLADRVLGSWLDSREYFGVPMDRDYVVERMIARQAAGSLIDDFEGRWPLLRKGHEEEAEGAGIGGARRQGDGGSAARSGRKDHQAGAGACGERSLRA